MARFRCEKTMRRISRMERIHLGKRFDFALVLSEKQFYPFNPLNPLNGCSTKTSISNGRDRFGCPFALDDVVKMISCKQS
jgi:hypothetical protein